MNRVLTGLVVLLVLSSLSRQGGAVDYKFTNIADNTTVGPNGVFTGFALPSISGDTVAFLCWTQTSSGIFTSSGGPLTTIVRRGDPGPTGPFSGFRDLSLSGENVAFHGRITDRLESSGIFLGNGGPLTTIAYKRDPAPSGIFWDFRNPVLSGDTVAFRATYGVAPSDDGVFTGTGGPLTAIAKQGDQFSGITLFRFLDPTISGNTVAFLAYYDDGGIFTGDGGPLNLQVQTGDSAPSGVFTTFRDASISGDNIAFIGAIDGIYEGVYLAVKDSGKVTTIAKDGDTAPIGTFRSIRDAALGGESVAFFADYGEFPFDPTGVGLFTGSGGPLNTVIRTGDSLFGSTLTDFDASQFSTTRAFGFDSGDTGNIAFVYRLADGRVGVALATKVPEPDSVTLWTIVLTFAAGGMLSTTPVVCMLRRIANRHAHEDEGMPHGLGAQWHKC